MSSPLDGPAFRLRQEIRIVDDEETTIQETSSDIKQQVHIAFLCDLWGRGLAVWRYFLESGRCVRVLLPSKLCRSYLFRSEFRSCTRI